jgi:hypothetical protein
VLSATGRTVILELLGLSIQKDFYAALLIKAYFAALRVLLLLLDY